MLAVLQQVEGGHLARFERHLQHSVEEVWSMLTENEKLAQWFSELQVGDLRKGGVIKFNMQDGTFEELAITDLKTYSVLEYTWWEDRVRFELHPTTNGCGLVLFETIRTITDHTPKDLAGWHVCLDVIHALLDGRAIESRMNEWKIWYEKYIKLINEYK
ncbi:SRPBCC family protein [Paenibacillus sp. SC116]|uniref:SRPBCC family protein n=1 Tax=Paenibacillus sp. SC116 TaxID=2968986 RepID=UPI00215B3696|nr:SRPBCC family protein [Paenibacillus sp. SC116]MCR8844511.1 SRPBCC family protein [Paenibacillus sp. SC116]